MGGGGGRGGQSWVNDNSEDCHLGFWAAAAATQTTWSKCVSSSATSAMVAPLHLFLDCLHPKKKNGATWLYAELQHLAALRMCLQTLNSRNFSSQPILNILDEGRL